MTLQIGNMMGPKIIDLAAYPMRVVGGISGVIYSAGWARVSQHTGGTFAVNQAATGYPSISANRYWGVWEHRIRDTGGSVGQESIIAEWPVPGGVLYLYWKRSSAGNYQLVLKHQAVTLVTGTTEYTFSNTTVRTVRATMTGSQIGIEYDGAVELNISSSYYPTDWGIKFTATALGVGLGKYQDYRNFAAGVGDDGDDRFAVPPTILFMKPNSSAGITHDAWDIGAPDTGEGKHEDWDDWSSGAGSQDGDSTYLITPSGDGEYKQTSQMTNVVATNPRCVMHYLCGADTDTAKNLRYESLMVDVDGEASEDIRVQSTTYTHTKACWPRFPTSAEWTDLKLDSLEAGCYSATSSGTRNKVTASAIEIVDVALDAGELPPLGVPYSQGLVI